MQDRESRFLMQSAFGVRVGEVGSRVQWNLLFQRMNSEPQRTNRKDVSYHLVASLGSSDKGCGSSWGRCGVVK